MSASEDRGIEAWKGLLAASECGVVWRARELLDNVSPASDVKARRAALCRAGAWPGTLPPRLAVESEEVVLFVAERCGYSPTATYRADEARFWNRLELERSSERELRRTTSLER